MYAYFITYLKFNSRFLLLHYIKNCVHTYRMTAVTNMFYTNSWVHPEYHFASNEQNLKF